MAIEFDKILDEVLDVSNKSTGVYNSMRDWIVEMEDYESLRKKHDARSTLENRFDKAERDWYNDKYSNPHSSGNRSLSLKNNAELGAALKNSTYRSAKAVLITSVDYGFEIKNKGKTELSREISYAKHLDSEKPESILAKLRGEINECSYKFRASRARTEIDRQNGAVPGTDQSYVKNLVDYEAEVSELAVACKGLLQSVLDEYQKAKDYSQRVLDMLEDEEDNE